MKWVYLGGSSWRPPLFSTTHIRTAACFMGHISAPNTISTASKKKCVAWREGKKNPSNWTTAKLICLPCLQEIVLLCFQHWSVLRNTDLQIYGLINPWGKPELLAAILSDGLVRWTRFEIPAQLSIVCHRYWDNRARIVGKIERFESTNDSGCGVNCSNCCRNKCRASSGNRFNNRWLNWLLATTTYAQ